MVGVGTGVTLTVYDKPATAEEQPTALRTMTL